MHCSRASSSVCVCGCLSQPQDSGKARIFIMAWSLAFRSIAGPRGSCVCELRPKVPWWTARRQRGIRLRSLRPLEAAASLLWPCAHRIQILTKSRRDRSPPPWIPHLCCIGMLRGSRPFQTEVRVDKVLEVAPDQINALLGNQQAQPLFWGFWVMGKCRMQSRCRSSWRRLQPPASRKGMRPVGAVCNLGLADSSTLQIL